MSKEIFYRQCVLKRSCQDYTEETTSWIPEQYAAVDGIIKLRDKNGVWTNGWKVISAGARLSEKQLPDPHAEIKGHRRNTKDSERRECFYE